MGSSTIFADESGDESAREERTDDRPRSVFRRRHDDAGRPNRNDSDRTDGDANTRDGDATMRDGDATMKDGDVDAGATMTVFSGDEVYEVTVDDRE